MDRQAGLSSGDVAMARNRRSVKFALSETDGGGPPTPGASPVRQGHAWAKGSPSAAAGKSGSVQPPAVVPSSSGGAAAAAGDRPTEKNLSLQHRAGLLHRPPPIHMQSSYQHDYNPDRWRPAVAKATPILEANRRLMRDGQLQLRGPVSQAFAPAPAMPPFTAATEYQRTYQPWAAAAQPPLPAAGAKTQPAAGVLVGQPQPPLANNELDGLTVQDISDDDDLSESDGEEMPHEYYPGSYTRPNLVPRTSAPTSAPPIQPSQPSGAAGSTAPLPHAQPPPATSGLRPAAAAAAGQPTKQAADPAGWANGGLRPVPLPLDEQRERARRFKTEYQRTFCGPVQPVLPTTQGAQGVPVPERVKPAWYDQNFSNIDRLNVHSELHKSGAMDSEDLRLKMTRSEQMIDQTPTPTRFLKACDDEGIFQDIPPKQNPFDETFQAGIPKSDASNQFSGVETLAAVAVASAAASPSHSDDELRASEAAGPSGVPHSAVGTMTSAANVPHYSINQGNRLTGPFMNGDIVVPVPPPASLANPESSVPMAIPPATFLPKGSSGASGSVPSSVRSAPKAAGSVAPDTKKRLQETLARLHPTAVTALSDPASLAVAVAASNSAMQHASEMAGMSAAASAGSSSPMHDSDDGDTHTVTISIEGASQSDGDGSQSSLDGTPKAAGTGKRRRMTEDLDPQEKRARFLQRNREAATRCREKRKEWISTLEKRSQDLSKHNSQLQAEVTALRNERAHLKVLLLSHKDCPITMQQKLMGQQLGQMAGADEAEAVTPAATETQTAAPSAVTTASQVMSQLMPSLMMPVASQGNPASPITTSNLINPPKGAVTLALPTPLNLTSGVGQVGSPNMTPLLMVPLTTDHLHMAVGGSAGGAPTFDLNSLQMLQQLHQQLRPAIAGADGTPTKAAGGGQQPTTPATPSTASVQALLNSAQYAIVQTALQASLQHGLLAGFQAQAATVGETSATAITAPGAPMVEEIHEVELQ